MRSAAIWRVAIPPLVTLLLAAACGPGRGPAAGPADSGSAGRISRTLKVVISNEPFEITDNLAGRAPFTVAMFGVPLVTTRDGFPSGMLSSAPKLGTDTWKVFPDGRMETTFKLKPGLTWHDGQPLTAEDMVFSYQLMSARVEHGLGRQISVPEFRAMEGVQATAPDTIVIRWRTLWVDGAKPSYRSFGPYAKHILESALENVAVAPDALEHHPYWTTEFVGTGPYRLTQWERGVFLEGTAFDGFAFGRPQIDKVQVTWSGDPNAIVARFLADDAHFAANFALRFTHGVTLRNQWASGGARAGQGVVVLTPTEDRQLIVQLRPDFADPRAILDLRVRKAVLHAIDRQAISDALTDGLGPVAMSLAKPDEVYHSDLLRVAPHYPFDPRRTEELMGQAGFTRGADGLYTSPTEGRLSPEVMGVAEGQDGEETTVAVDYLRRAGIDAQLNLQPASRLNASDEMKATFRAFRNTYRTDPEKFYGGQIASPANNWRGLNKSGWLNAENDRLVDLLAITLDVNERNLLFVAAHKNMVEQLPALPLYFAPAVVAYSADLQGPTGPTPGTTAYMGLHEWKWGR